MSSPTLRSGARRAAAAAAATRGIGGTVAPAAPSVRVAPSAPAAAASPVAAAAAAAASSLVPAAPVRGAAGAAGAAASAPSTAPVAAPADARPKALEEADLAVIRATAPVVGAHALEIIKVFYPMMFSRNPEVLSFFNKTNQARGRQPAALANAVVAFATHIDNLGAILPAVDEMAVKHCGLNVLPEHYGIVEDNLIRAVAQVLGDAVTPEVGGAWTRAVQMLSRILYEREEEFYAAAEAAPGGWRGWAPFKVAKKVALADDTTLFRFARNDAGIAFSPGQFLTLRCPKGDHAQPRHYTIVSPPNQPYLEIAVRTAKGEAGQPDGFVSSWLANEVQEGDTVDLAPPFGLYGLDSSLEKGRDVLLVSAGIGITPIRAFAQALAGGKTKVAHVHQDRSPSAHPFAAEFADGSCVPADKCFARYNSTDTPFAPAGHLTADDVARAMAAAGLDPANTTAYCCGPTDLMEHLAAELPAKHGVAAVLSETFGPQLANPHLKLAE